MIIGGLLSPPSEGDQSPADTIAEKEFVREVPVEEPAVEENTVVKQEAVATPVAFTLMPAATVTSTTAQPQPISPNTTLILSRGATISGGVIDAESGLPVANVEIKAQSVVDDGPDSYASTDADGRYTLRGVAPGSYRIRARLNRQNYIQEFYGDTFNRDDASLVTVRGNRLRLGDSAFAAGLLLSMFLPWRLVSKLHY